MIGVADDVGIVLSAGAVEVALHDNLDARLAGVVASARNGERVVAQVCEAHRQFRHVFAVELGGVVGAKGEDVSVVGCHVRRDADGERLHDVRRYNVADDAGDIVVVAINQLPPLGEQVVGGGGIDLCALRVVHRLGVVAAGDGCPVGGQAGGSGNGVGTCFFDIDLLGREEAVGDDGFISGGRQLSRLLSQQTAAVVGADSEQTAGEGTARHRGVDGIAHETAVVGSAVVDAVDGDTADHVLERDVCHTIASHHATGMDAAGVDGACRAEVLDGCAIGVVEGSSKLLHRRVIDGQRVAVTEEHAAEDMVSV